MITYDVTFSGRSQINHAFERQGLVADIVLTAIDSDVIKTYVELGLGVGIIAEMAFDPARDRPLGMAANHLFATNTTRMAFRRDSGYAATITTSSNYWRHNSQGESWKRRSAVMATIPVCKCRPYLVIPGWW